MVPYSLQERGPGFDAFLLTIATELLQDVSPRSQELGHHILHCMKGNESPDRDLGQR